MGRYSRKDMLEFAKFAKSYQSPKKVDDAYELYLCGVRMVSIGTEEFLIQRYNTIKNERRIRRQNEKELREQNQDSVTT
jgi:hypothetical protein